MRTACLLAALVLLMAANAPPPHPTDVQPPGMKRTVAVPAPAPEPPK